MSHTERLGIDDLERAAEILANGGILAFPTETVFGLGGLATREETIQQIFLAKGRPSDNPLIVHVASIADAAKCAREIPPLAIRLWEQFAPGPLTLILPKHPSLAHSVTAGLDTVGVRIPNHPWALPLLRQVRQPIAAPSANRSGRPSGTTWQSVLEDLDRKIDAILCGPQADVGLESTVLDLCQDPPCILRAGAIRREQLLPWIPHLATAPPTMMASDVARRSPGTRHPHYQPNAKVILVDGIREAIADAERHLAPAQIEPSPSVPKVPIAFLGLADPSLDKTRSQATFDPLYICSTIEEYASQLFEFLREAERRNCRVIYCQRVDEQGLGTALMDRLHRASN